MRTLWKISTFTILLFTLTACMPDSLTKFKEDPTKLGDESTSTGGTGSDEDEGTETCLAGTDPSCTSPGTFSYPGDKNYKFLIYEDGEDFELPLIVPAVSNYIVGHEEYLTITTPTNFTTETGLSIDPEEDFKFIGEPERFLPKTFYEVTATYSTPEFSSDEVNVDTFAITIARDLESIIYPTKVGSLVILEVDSITPFSSVSGYNFISAENGVSGLINYIDSENKELHITISENTGQGYFSINGSVDNSSSFFDSKATVNAIYNTYSRSTDIQNSLSPTVLGYQTLGEKELSSISYSIFPSLPAGLSFDQMTGTIGTLRAYQVVTDGTLSVSKGSRSITGNGTLFLSHLQVNSTVEINGELHKIESIDSNSLAKTYTPFSSTASATSFKKILKGSVSLTAGSSLMTGTGTDFSTEVIPSKSILVDSISDFTGLTSLTGAINSVNSATSITLNSTFAGTALTVPELKATSYVVTAKNILGKTVNRLVTISLLNPIQPKTLTSVAHNFEPNDKVILYVADGSSFTKGGYITNQYGTSAIIDNINENTIFATIRNTVSKKCTLEGYTTEANCIDAGGVWINKNFDNGDLVDNRENYLLAETTLAKDATLSLGIDSGIFDRPLETTPAVSDTGSLEFSIQPNLATSGVWFCLDPQFTTASTCNIDTSGNWTTDFFFVTADQCSDGVSTTEALCDTANHTWIEKGKFYGVPTSAIAETEFTITTTTLLGKSFDTTVTLGASTAPKGLSLTRNVLLHVPSVSSFDIGDAISSRSGGLGTVIGKFTMNKTPLGKDSYQYSFLEVKLIKGKFIEGEDLDNLPSFSSQKTYILGEGVYKYNTKVTALSTDNLVDPEYSTYVANQNLLQVGSQDRARVIYNNEDSDTLYLTVYDTTTSASNVEPTSLTTGDALDAVNLNQTITVVDLISNDIIANVSASNLGLPSSSKGYDITSDGGGIGMLHYFDSLTGDDAYIEITEGEFKSLDNLDTTSPYVAPAGSITSIRNDYTFYLYRGVEASIEVSLDILDSNTLVSLDKELPDGLVIETGENGISRIIGTPTSPSIKEKFTLTASNAFGSTSYEFFLRVYDQMNLVNTASSSTYILHKTGKGNGRKPCSITEDQMNSGDLTVRNISCFLDAGEDELHANGIKMEIQVGQNLCSFVEETPHAFWNFAPGLATRSVPNGGLGVSTLYKHTGYDECTSGTRPSEDYSQNANGTGPISGITHALLNLTAQTPKELCIYNYNTQLDDPTYPSCDEGEFTIMEVSWAPQAYECYNTDTSSATGDTDSQECENNNGVCVGDSDNDGDKESCEDIGTGTWTSHASDNDILGGSATPIVGACIAETPTIGVEEECGGDQFACIGGARSTWTNLTPEDLKNGVSTIKHNMTGSPAPTSVPIDYTDSYNSSEINDNFWYTNYLKQCSADLYKPDVTTYDSVIPGIGRSVAHYANGTHHTYLYECKDGFGDVRGRINLIVRDFDKKFKVKFGFCSDPSLLTKEECVLPATWTQSGIDYYDPDSLLGSLNDERNTLNNSESSDFSVLFNRYNNIQSIEASVGGDCGATTNPVFDFGGTCSTNSSFRDKASCESAGETWAPGTQVHPQHFFSR